MEDINSPFEISNVATPAFKICGQEMVLKIIVD